MSDASFAEIVQTVAGTPGEIKGLFRALPAFEIRLLKPDLFEKPQSFPAPSPAPAWTYFGSMASTSAPSFAISKATLPVPEANQCTFGKGQREHAVSLPDEICPGAVIHPGHDLIINFRQRLYIFLQLNLGASAQSRSKS